MRNVSNFLRVAGKVYCSEYLGGISYNVTLKSLSTNPKGYSIPEVKTSIKSSKNIVLVTCYSGVSRISPRLERQLSEVEVGAPTHYILPNVPKNCMKLKEFGCSIFFYKEGLIWKVEMNEEYLQ